MDSSAPITAGHALLFAHPAAALLFALFSLCIWSHARQRRYLLLYAAAFSLYAAGALLTALDRAVLPWHLIAAALYVASALLLSRSLLVRAGAQADASPLTAVSLAILSLLVYFDAVQPDASAFAHTLGMGAGALLLMAWMRLRTIRPASREDRVLFWLLPAVVAALFLGTSWTASVTGGMFPGPGSADSWDVLLSSLVVLVALGSALIAAALSDVVSLLKQERVTDPLTQLLNRRNFEECGYNDVQRYAEYPSSFILLDLDGFKYINDTYGHDAGDTALAEVGNVIRQCIRNGDLAWRLGGDEFAILMSGTISTSAVQAADRIRTRLAQTPLRTAEGAFTLAASFGVAQSRVGEPLYDLFVRADRRLYAAKRQGRNRIEAENETAPADAPVLGKSRALLSL